MKHCIPALVFAGSNVKVIPGLDSFNKAVQSSKEY